MSAKDQLAVERVERAGVKAPEVSSCTKDGETTETLMLKDAIGRNRQRHARFEKYEALLVRLCLRVFDYEAAGKEDKAERVMQRCKAICMPFWEARKRATSADKERYRWAKGHRRRIAAVRATVGETP
jgi:hypothetical protein